MSKNELVKIYFDVYFFVYMSQLFSTSPLFVLFAVSVLVILHKSETFVALNQLSLRIAYPSKVTLIGLPPSAVSVE